MTISERPTGVRLERELRNMDPSPVGPRVQNPLVVPREILSQPEDIYDPTCPAPWIMQDAIPVNACCAVKKVYTPRSQAQTLYNTVANDHPQFAITTIDNALYGMDLSRFMTVGGVPKKVTAHFKPFPRSDFRPYEYREYADCLLPVPTMKRWGEYPILKAECDDTGCRPRSDPKAAFCGPLKYAGNRLPAGTWEGGW